MSPLHFGHHLVLHHHLSVFRTLSDNVTYDGCHVLTQLRVLFDNCRTENLVRRILLLYGLLYPIETYDVSVHLGLAYIVFEQVRAVDIFESFLSLVWGVYILDAQDSFFDSSTFDYSLSLLVMARVAWVRLVLLVFLCQFYGNPLLYNPFLLPRIEIDYLDLFQTDALIGSGVVRI